MNEMIYSSLLITPTIVLLLISLLSFSLRVSYKSIQLALYAAIFSGTGAMIWSYFNDALGTDFFRIQNWALSVRFDTLSSLVYTMIGIIGLVVVRYSRNYLDGEVRHKQFITRLAITLAFVQLVVISGNLPTLFIAWIGASIGLHKLLLFYPDRKKARLAARKKFVIARIGDLTLLWAFILIYRELGTADLSSIFEKLKAIRIETLSFGLELAGILLVVTACLKSVQVPFHGWLLEVMETPTPVSALLHAGLLNAGPYLILRFAYLIDLTTYATTILILIGAISALFGVVAANAQPAVKTSLAYSSIGHMGFTLFICGLGVYSASLLHLVAHSFYKAHAFLSSGSLIDKVQTSGALHFKREHRIANMLIAVISSGILYVAVSYLWYNSSEPEFQLLIITGVIFLGILSLHVNTLDSNIAKRSVFYLITASLVVVNCFYLFEHSFATYLGGQIPDIRALNGDTQLLVLAIIILFTLTVLSQSVFGNLNKSPLYRRLEIHFRNGLYLNQLMNRFMRSLTIDPIK